MILLGATGISTTKSKTLVIFPAPFSAVTVIVRSPAVGHVKLAVLVKLPVLTMGDCSAACHVNLMGCVAVNGLNCRDKTVRPLP